MASLFEIRQRQSTPAREVVGGLTTFMAMSYILFVQPAVLSKAGMDPNGVFMATCISSAVACVLMGLASNYPIALAPGMGENIFFVFTLCGVGTAAGVFRLSWPEALALTAAVGVIFLLMSTVGLRSMLLNAIPNALKSGIAAGIGLFIALIGLEWGNVIKGHPETYVALADVRGNYVAGLTLLGLAVTMALMAFHVRGAILIGILATTAATWGVGAVWGLPAITYHGIVGMPHGLAKTAGALWSGFATLGDKLLDGHALEVIGFAFILLFMDLFDTVGTLVGVASRADLMVDGKLPRAQHALMADAVGTVAGGCLGTSTVTSFIESVTGVASGARTGLAAVVTGLCMLAALFFQPLVQMIGGGVNLAPEGAAPILRYPMIAPALVVVGAMMMRAMREIEWDEITEALPAFLAMVSIPFTFSIATGIAIGFVSYAFGKLVSGRPRQCPVLVYVFAVLFVLQYVVGAWTHAIH
ncbi:MAG TPA: NCS2 family permease [Phycisphaerae bacterium]|nr:NCS2 family permease [Phycisphaerae bacterium]